MPAFPPQSAFEQSATLSIDAMHARDASPVKLAGRLGKGTWSGLEKRPDLLTTTGVAEGTASTLRLRASDPEWRNYRQLADFNELRVEILFNGAWLKFDCAAVAAEDSGREWVLSLRNIP